MYDRAACSDDWFRHDDVRRRVLGDVHGFFALVQAEQLFARRGGEQRSDADGYPDVPPQSAHVAKVYFWSPSGSLTNALSDRTGAAAVAALAGAGFGASFFRAALAAARGGA